MDMKKLIECLEHGTIHVGSWSGNLLVAHFEPKTKDAPSFKTQSDRGIHHLLLLVTAKFFNKTEIEERANTLYRSIGVQGSDVLTSLLARSYGCFDLNKDHIRLETKECKIPSLNDKPGIYRRIIEGSTIDEIIEKVNASIPELCHEEYA